MTTRREGAQKGQRLWPSVHSSGIRTTDKVVVRVEGSQNSRGKEGERENESRGSRKTPVTLVGAGKGVKRRKAVFQAAPEEMTM